MIFNATPVGMAGDKATPLEENELNALWVFDSVYNPIETPLLKLAQAKGCGTISGAEMFVHQAARQFEIWTGKPAADRRDPAGFAAPVGSVSGRELRPRSRWWFRRKTGPRAPLRLRWKPRLRMKLRPEQRARKRWRRRRGRLAARKLLRARPMRGRRLQRNPRRRRPRQGRPKAGKAAPGKAVSGKAAVGKSAPVKAAPVKAGKAAVKVAAKPVRKAAAKKR